MEVESVSRPSEKSANEEEPLLLLVSQHSKKRFLLTSLAFNCLKRVIGLVNGSGSCHSQWDSPKSLMTTVLCFHLSKSDRDCLAVGMIPLAIGSAGSLPVGAGKKRILATGSKLSG